MRKRKLTVTEYTEKLAIGFGRSTIEERYLKTKTGEVSRNLKILRATIRVTSLELSELSGVTHSVIRSVETGHRTFLVEPALLISLATGVDLWSLMAGKLLLEWGGENPYTEESYKKWVECGRSPTEIQANQEHLQLERLCEAATKFQAAGHAGQALLSGYLRVLTGAMEEGVQSAGLSD